MKRVPGLVLLVLLPSLALLAADAAAGMILHEEVTTSERSPARPARRPAENLLDTMDVYTLSPHAIRLRLPRMVSPALAARLRANRAAGPSKQEWRRIIAVAAARHKLDPALIAAVIRAESAFDPHALSHKGAQGAMQLMPSTQTELGVRDPFDPEANVLAGSAYLKAQLERFRSLPLALAAYNAGPGNVEKYGGIPPFRETRAYVRAILRALEPGRP